MLRSTSSPESIFCCRRSNISTFGICLQLSKRTSDLLRRYWTAWRRKLGSTKTNQVGGEPRAFDFVIEVEPNSSPQSRPRIQTKLRKLNAFLSRSNAESDQLSTDNICLLMLLKGVCLRTLGYPYQALESLQQVLKQYVSLLIAT